MLSLSTIKDPSESELLEIRSFLRSNKGFWPEQDPEIFRIINPGKSMTIFVGRNDDRITFYALAKEHYRRAHIQLGPLFRDFHDAREGMSEIIRHYRSRRFASIDVQSAICSDAEANAFKTEVLNGLQFDQKDDERNWSSIIIDLGKEEEEIFKAFRTNHRRSVKKAGKKGGVVREMSLTDVDPFTEVYEAMYRSRGLAMDFDAPAHVFKDLLDGGGDLVKSFGLVVEEDEEIIGGVICVGDDDTMYYKFGAASPQHRQIPVLHLAFFEAMKKSRSMGAKRFDLGGYNRYVSDDSQVAGINHFKEGFGGEIVDFERSFIFTLNPVLNAILNTLRKLRSIAR